MKLCSRGRSRQTCAALPDAGLQDLQLLSNHVKNATSAGRLNKSAAEAQRHFFF